MANLKVAKLYFYPVKSCAGTELETANIGKRGIEHDREWMVVDEDGYFLTQRQIPSLALIEPELDRAGNLHMSAPDMPLLHVESGSGAKCPVTVWRDSCLAFDAGARAADWLSHFLRRPCRLVQMDPDFQRQVDQNFARRNDDEVGFADGFAFLLFSAASLHALNARLAEPVPLNRFRPNIVVAGAEPFAEDNWRQINIGNISFDVVKPCARCVITTIDQESGMPGKEPLQTLAKFRLFDGKILFGQNLAHQGTGTISVGDPIAVLT